MIDSSYVSFFDTNILVYLFDSDAPDKKSVAQRLVTDEVDAGRFCISTQVLQELYVVLTRKLEPPLSLPEAEQVIREFSSLAVIPVDTEIILKAIQLQQRINYSFWDSLIVQSALYAGAVRVYSEDMQHGRRIDELKIVNPFV